MAVSHIIISIANQIINLRQQILKFTEQIIDSRQQILTMAANSEQYRPNNKCFLGIWHSIEKLHCSNCGVMLFAWIIYLTWFIPDFK